MPRLLTDDEIDRQLATVPDWHRGGADRSSISTTVELTDFAGSLRFVNLVGAEAEELDHHPDIDIRWNKVTMVLSTHSEGGLTQLDIELAHRISELPRG